MSMIRNSKKNKTANQLKSNRSIQINLFNKMLSRVKNRRVKPLNYRDNRLLNPQNQMVQSLVINQNCHCSKRSEKNSIEIT